MILLYHRIAAESSDPWDLAVSPSHLAEHLEVLTRYGPVLQLQNLVRQLKVGNLPPRAVIITFDDGYTDNLYNAKPLLERYDVPATVFLTTSNLGSDRELWWDELEKALLRTKRLPTTLCLKVNGRKFHWAHDDSASHDTVATHNLGRWKMGEKPPSPRHTLYCELWKKLSVMQEDDRREVMEEIANWAGTDLTGRATHRLLSPEEVVDLAKGELIEIGAHTVTHSALSALPEEMQRHEIQKSKDFLDALIGKQVISFAYPHGRYSPRTVALVRDLGLRCACTTDPGSVDTLADCFRLPRTHVKDWNGEEFEKRLLACFA
jgi:peptidoglycan/xylan/chitin deacetylase (PgdA/CDA1 family)